ncbi:hypothetical protein ACFQ67_21150 [Streptomyces sp. NPDC056488]|uniref:hypothetical protein n=1 Tax=Streptomyces sp. NPDC056488 TaxID=3345836 RepID=UPI0036B953B0
MTEFYGWPLPEDTEVVRQWAALGGSLPAELVAVSFDPASGVLSLRGKSIAWSTHGRLMADRIVQDMNKALGRNLVSKVVILPPQPASSSVPVPAWVPHAFAAATRSAHQDTRLADTLRRQSESAPHEPTHLFPSTTEQPAAASPADAVRARAAARARADRDWQA